VLKDALEFLQPMKVLISHALLCFIS